MATLVLGVAGAAVGSLFGNPALGWSVGTILGGYLFGPKPPSQEIGKLDDLRLSGSAYGAMIPQTWGDGNRIGGNVFWKAPLEEHKTTKKEGGGKGSKPKSTTTTYSYTLSFAVGVCKGPIESIKRIWAEDNTLLYDATQTPTSLHNVFLYLGEEDQLPNSLMESFEGAGNVPAYRDWAYVVFEDLDLSQWGNRPPAMSFEVVQNSSCVLSDVLKDLSKQVGFIDEQLDLDAADNPVRGIALTQRMDAETFISGILRLYFIDLTEVDGQIVVIKRGEGLVYALEEEDLGVTIWNGFEPPIGGINTKMAMDIDLPFRVDVVYYDSEREYQQSSQTAVMHARNLVDDVRTVSAPVVMTPDEAKQIAEATLQIAWLERRSFTISLPPDFTTIPIGSKLTFPLEDTIQRVRVVSKDISVIGPVVVTVVPDDEGATSVQTHLPGGSTPSVPAVMKGIMPTTFEVWSFPAVRGEDLNKTGFYVAATGDSKWDGCVVYYSTNEINWINAGSILDKTEFGHATNHLGDWVDVNTIDGVASLDVILEVAGELETTDLDHVLEGFNACLIGEEMASFQDSNKTSSLHFTLTNFKRGWLDSDMTGHVDGELFVMLEESIMRVNVRSELAGETVYVRCVSNGQSIDDVVSKTVVIYDPTTAVVVAPIALTYDYKNEIILYSDDSTPDPRLSLDKRTFSTLLPFEVNTESVLVSLRRGVIAHPKQTDSSDDLGYFQILKDTHGLERRISVKLSEDGTFESSDDVWYWYVSKSSNQRAAFLYNFTLLSDGEQELTFPDGASIPGSGRVWLRKMWLRPTLWGLTESNTKIIVSDYGTETDDILSVFIAPSDSPIAIPFRHAIILTAGQTYIDIAHTPVLKGSKRSYILLIGGILDVNSTITNDGLGQPRRVNISDSTDIDGIVADIMGYHL